MSFRRKDTRSEQAEWQAWLTEQSELVRASGLPTLVLRDEEHWLDFLEHGYLDHHDDPSQFTLSDLELQQKAALLRLIMGRPSLLNTVVGHRLIGDMVQEVEMRFRPDPK